MRRSNITLKHTTLLLAALILLSACATGEIQTVVVTEIVEGEAVERVIEITTTPNQQKPTRDTIIYCSEAYPDGLYVIGSNGAYTHILMTATGLRAQFGDRAYGAETQMLVNGEFPTLENGGAVIEGEGADAVLTVTFRYREDIVWSDGEPFTVDDVLFTVDVMRDPDSGAVYASYIEKLTFEKVDDYTYQVSYPPGILDPYYNLPLPVNLPKHVLGEMTPAEIRESDYALMPDPVLGPYRIVEWVEADRVVMEANPYWWNGDVRTPNLIFRGIPDTNALLAAVMSGECDFMGDAQLPQLPIVQRLSEQGLANYEAIPASIWEHIDFNVMPPENAERGGLPFFADQRVRQAVAYGTNRQVMADEILFGEVQPLTSYLPSDHWAWNPTTAGRYPYDPDRARALLEEAGWTDSDGDGFREAVEELTGEYGCGYGSWTIPAGTPFEVDFHTTSSNAMREQIATLFQADMQAIGLKVNLDLLPMSVWFGDDGPLSQRTYQVGEFAWVVDADPDMMWSYLGVNIYRTPDGDFVNAVDLYERDSGVLSGIDYDFFAFGRPTEDDLPEGYELTQGELIPSEEDGWDGINYLSWCDPQASQAIFDGQNVLAHEERLPHYLTFQEVFVEQMPSLPLFQRVQISAYAPDLCGVDLGPANWPTWNIETWYFAAPGETCE